MEIHYFLLRENNKIEFYENPENPFIFLHSDGRKRTIYLNVNGRYQCKYGKDVFYTYLCHENIPTPLPEDPLITTEQMNMNNDRAMQIMEEWKMKGLDGKRKLIVDTIKAVGLLIGISVGAYILYKNVCPNEFTSRSNRNS